MREEMRRSMMDIQPIKNERDYDKALAEIEKLWGSQAPFIMFAKNA